MSGEGPSCSQGLQRNYKLIKNRRGGQTLLHAGYSYNLQRNNKVSSVWTCTNKKRQKCTGSVKLVNQSDNVQIQMKHIAHCEPNTFKNELCVVMDKIKKEVTTNFNSVQKIFELRIAQLKNKGFDADIPVYSDVKTALYSQRNKALKVPKTKFKEPSDVIIPEKFQTHVFIDYNENKNRIIVFASKKALKEIKNVRHYFCDGTFECCPSPFKQIFTIHGDVGYNADMQDTNIVPLFYVLLKNKEKETYKTMFIKIKEALPEFDPIKFTLDFEMATIFAITELFPQATIHGCFIHFQRSIYRKAKSLGLMDHEETSLYVKLCASLAFLPEQDIEDGWLAVAAISYPEENVTKFNDYFVTQWLEPGGMIQKWCCHKERHRTTNLVEAWNQRLQSYLGRRPTILSFLEIVELDISTYDTALERLRIKEKSVSQRTIKSINTDKVIAKLTEDYLNKKITIMSFLENIRPFIVLKQKI